MRPLPAQAQALSARVQAAVAALAEQLEAGDAPSLVVLEQRMQDLLKEYRALLAETGLGDRTGPPTGVAKDDYNAFVRSVVALASMTALVAGKVGGSAGIAWGHHLFGEHDLGPVRHDALELALPERAVKRILVDQAGDLLGAFTELAELLPGRPHGRISAVERSLERICRALDCRGSVRRSLGFTLWDAASFASELGINEDEAVRRAEAREVVAVKSWTGQWQFPDYQTVRGALRDEVALVCADADPGFKGWPLAIWLGGNLGQTPAYYEQLLGGRGLWRPHWGDAATGAFNGIIRPAQAPPPTELWRNIKRGYGPFFFSSAKPSAPGAPAPPAGRFDLPAHTDRGSLYTAATPAGACAEVLDREPVVTLRHLLHRVLWRLAPNEQLKLADLSSAAALLAATTNRNDTQELAERLSATWQGMQVPLRTGGSDPGAVLFGPVGAVLPAAAGLGLWSAEPEPLIQSDHVWDYLDQREALTDGFPIVLRRFPEEIDY